jgi:hypothetical protein
MNTYAGWAALLLCITPSALAADRYVADAMTAETLPSGETVVRLISQNRQTAQLWVNSVYGAQDALVVFEGRGGAPLPATYARQQQKPAPINGSHADARNDSLAVRR